MVGVLAESFGVDGRRPVESVGCLGMLGDFVVELSLTELVAELLMLPLHDRGDEPVDIIIVESTMILNEFSDENVAPQEELGGDLGCFTTQIFGLDVDDVVSIGDVLVDSWQHQLQLYVILPTARSMMRA